MKKVLITMLCLFSFIGIGLAKSKYNSKVYVKYDNKITKKINIKEKKEITIDLYFEAKDFDLYGIVSKLDYNKDLLELKDYEAYNNFEVMAEKNILADRIDIPDKEDHKVLSLTFTIKKNKTNKIIFKDINVANTEEQFKLDDLTIKLSNGSGIVIVISVIAGIVVIGGVVLVIKKKKTK